MGAGDEGQPGLELAQVARDPELAQVAELRCKSTPEVIMGRE